MKRFFTKKSIALIVAIFIVSSFLPFHVSLAANSPTWTDPKTNIQYVYRVRETNIVGYTIKGTNVWHEVKEGGRDLTTAEMIDLGLKNAQQLADDYSVSVGLQKPKEGWGRFFQMIENSTGFIKDVALDFVVTILEFVTIPIASFCLAIAGVVLDFSIQYTVYGEGFKIMADTIQSLWVLIRDTANIFFIFVLLYAAIKQIVDGSAPKEILKSVIIAAILVNFSLFATRIVVDASNIVATSIYNQITTSTEATTNTPGALVSLVDKYKGVGILQIDLSGRIMDGLNLTGISNNSTLSNTPTGVTGIGALLGTVTKLILYLVTTYVFILLAGILISRFVMLVFLMATSPIGFVGDVVPGLGEHSKNWRKSLSDQALIAPLFMFFMLLTIRISQMLNLQGTGENPMVVAFNFFFVVYLLLKSIKILKGLSGELGEIAGKIASSATGLAVGASVGGTALLARQSVGRVASGAIRDFGETLEARGAKGGVVGTLANITSAGLKGTASSTFDMRNTGTFKEVYGQAKGIAGGTELVDSDSLKAGGIYGKGKGQKTGFVGGEEEKKNAIKEQAEKYSKSAIDSEKEIENEYNIKEAALQRKIDGENDLLKKAELKVQLQELKKEREEKTGAGIEKEIERRAEPIIKQSESAIKAKKIEINQAEHEDFGNADAKIKTAQEELKKKRKAAEDALFIAERLGNTKDKNTIKNQLKADEEKITNDIKKLQDDLNAQRKVKTDKLNEELKDLEESNKKILGYVRKGVENDVEAGKYGTSEQKLILARRKMKENYAKAIRGTRIFTMNTALELEKLAEVAESVAYDEKKSKEKATEDAKEEKIIEKAAEKLAEKMEKEKK